MREDRRLAYLLVAIQFAALGYLAFTGPVLFMGWSFLLVAAGGALGLWAVWSMRRSKFNVTPGVLPGARLIEAGPYRWIRHPMYTSLLLLSLGLVLQTPTPGRWLALAILTIDLIVKLSYEERFLASAFPSYPEYRTRTKRLVPYLF
jgi:protein-S-isoprenylcysteine O-methyltransferase Ste14